ncbi:MAG TPA: hypothetical protein VIU87_06335 [Mycobacterium sp.]
MAALTLAFPVEAPTWRITQVVADNADMIVKIASQAALRGDAPFSIRLLEVLADLPAIKVLPDVAKIGEYMDRLHSEKSAAETGDPFSAAVLPGTGEVFINRTQMRESLRLMVKPKPGTVEPIVLRVFGDSSTGMSYTYAFLKHLAPAVGFSPTRAILTRNSTPRDVLRQLKIPIAGNDFPSESVRSQAQRLRYWAQWLVEAAIKSETAESAGPWWFVVDECNKLSPQAEDVVEFICQLSVAVGERPAIPNRPRPRLVLLGHGEMLGDLPIPPKQIRPDQVQRVSEKDVRTFFYEHYKRQDLERRPGVAVDDGLLRKKSDAATVQVLREADLAERNQKCYMEALARAAAEAIDVYA